MRRWFSKLAMVGVILATTLGATATAAHADTPWEYTTDSASSGRAKFWTDPGGSANEEELAVCDANDNGLGVIVILYGENVDKFYELQDSLPNGNCVEDQRDLFDEGTRVHFQVCQFKGHVYNSGDTLFDCRWSDWATA